MADLLRPVRGGWATLAAATERPPVRASIDVDVVWQRFNFEWATDAENGAEQDTYWWWARSIRMDPNEVIADDGEGGLWSVPFTTDGEDQVTFGQPTRVRETFVPVAASDGAAATALVERRRQRVIAAALERPEKPDRSITAASSATIEEDERMTDAQRRALARAYGLAEDATEEQINERIAADDTATVVAETEPVVETTESTAEHAPGSETEQPEAERELVAASAAAATRQTLNLPVTATDQEVAEAVARLHAGAQAGEEARRTQLAAERDRLVDDAIKDGRIPPSARQAWRDALDRQPEAEAAALTAMQPGRIPVRERGATPDPDSRDRTSLNRALAASGINTNGRGRGEKVVIRRG